MMSSTLISVVYLLFVSVNAQQQTAENGHDEKPLELHLLEDRKKKPNQFVIIIYLFHLRKWNEEIFIVEWSKRYGGEKWIRLEGMAVCSNRLSHYQRAACERPKFSRFCFLFLSLFVLHLKTWNEFFFKERRQGRDLSGRGRNVYINNSRREKKKRKWKEQTKAPDK